MIKFNKVFNSKVISLILACVFLFTNITYGIDIPERPHLRKPLDFNGPNVTPRYLRMFLAAAYHSSLKQNLSPEEALKRTKETLHSGTITSSWRKLQEWALQGKQKIKTILIRDRSTLASPGLTRQEAAESVELERFVWAQYKLAEKNISKESLSRILGILGLDIMFIGEVAYKAIYEALGSKGYTKEVVGLIIGDTYPAEGVRLDVEIIGQNKNPRTQSICEGVSNGLDAHGFHVGQFGKGVKQIIDWLETAGEDKIEVFTRRKNGKAYKLLLFKDAQGKRYIQIKEISQEEYQRLTAECAGQTIEYGTIVKVTTTRVIPRLESQRDGTHRNSQEGIVNAIRERFPFVGEVDISTQMSGQREPVKVNGFESKRVVVPIRSKSHTQEESQGRFVKVIVSEHAITIADNGSGMDAEVLSRMFVPKEGTKRPAVLELNIEKELDKVKVVYDEALSHRVSFSRNGEVIIAVDIPEEIMGEATIAGGLMVELGGLLDVPESRDNIIMGLNFGGAKTSGFQQGIEYAIRQIVEHPRLTAGEKIKYINTIIVGLDGLINANANNSHLVKSIRANISGAISSLIQELRSQGVIILPHQKEFSKLELEGKNALFMHEKLFDWQMSTFLNTIGGEIVPYVTLGGANRLPLIVAPFTRESIKMVSKFDRLWHTWIREERLPVIKTERFVVIPQEFGRRLLELSKKRSSGLTVREEKEYSSLLQRVNIITAEEVVTSYEHAKPKDNLAVTAMPRVEDIRGEIDSAAINKFLKEPPEISIQKGAKEADVQAKNPEDVDLVKEANGIAEGMPYNYSRCSSFAALAKGLANAGRIDEAKEALNKARAFYEKENDAFDDTRNKCNALIALALAEAEIGYINLAFDTLRKAYLNIRNIYEGDSNNQSWLQVKAVEAFIMVIDRSNGFTGNINRLEIFEQIINFTNDITYSFAKTKAIASIAKALAETGGLLKEEEIYASAIKLVNMTKSGDLDFRNLDEVIAMIEALTASSIPKEMVYNLLKQIKSIAERSEEKEKILPTIAKAFFKIGAEKDARKLFNTILINIEKLPSRWYKKADLFYVTSALVESNLPREEVYILLQKAQRIAQKLIDSGNRAEALAVIAVAYIKINKDTDAESVLQKTLLIAQNVSHADRERLRIFRDIASTLADTDKEQDVFDIMVKKLDLYEVLELLSQLSIDVEKLTKNRRIKEAGELCDRILGVLRNLDADSVAREFDNIPGYPYFLLHMAQGLAEAGKADEALDMARKITDKGDRLKCEALVSIVKAFVRENRVDEAKVMLKEIFELIKSIRFSDEKEDAFLNIIEALTEIGAKQSQLFSSAKLEDMSVQRVVSSPEEIEAAEKNRLVAVEHWMEEIFSLREKFIRQAQSAYQPFMDLIPEEFKNRIEASLGQLMEKLYTAQEDEINRRFQQALENNQPINFEGLPFDIFSSRIQQVMEVLSAFLEEAQAQLSQEQYNAQEGFYYKLFSNLFELCGNTDLNLEVVKVDKSFLEALAYGWNISQERINVLSSIIKFIAALKGITPAEVERLTSIISILSAASLQTSNPVEAVITIANQMNKLLVLKPQARDKYLSDLYSAFELFDDISARRSFSLKDINKLGKARPFVVFLTNNVEQVKERERVEPEGVDEFNARGHEEAIALSQIIKLEQQRPKSGSSDTVMEIEELVRNIFNLPQASAELEADILLNTIVQRESGAYTAEIAQNSRDATRDMQGELVIDYYIQKNSQGEEEYVEEAQDNGTGALKEAALLIPKSTKAAGGQIEITGFFGTGKYTMFEGVDRLEIITKNSQRAYMFIFVVIRDSSGRPSAVKLTRIRKIADPKVSQGVTVRRIKALDNTIPELDQMLSQRSWKTFVGLAQDEHFEVFFIDHDGKKQPLTVEKEVLAEVEFKAIRPQEKEETSFGMLRIISAKDMPLQIVDKAGLRVGEIKEEYLALIPSVLRRHIQELGIIIQIPLPLIRNRSAFEHENEFLPQIQRYIAIAFYQAIAYKALSQSSPQFVFEGFPLDWETNDSYWQSINPVSDRGIIGIANAINGAKFEQVSEEALRGLLTEQGMLDKEKKCIKLILLLEVLSDRQNLDSKVSLLTRRLAIQEEADKTIINAAELQRKLLRTGGFSIGKLPSLSDIPFSGSKVMQAIGIAAGHNQMRHPERYIVNPDDYSDNERELVTLALGIANNFGIEQIILLNDEVKFAGAFKSYQDKHTMFLARSMASKIGQISTDSITIDSTTDTIIHELGHLLEEFMHQDNQIKLWQKGYIAHMSDFTHDAVGTFAEAMKYAAAISLANNNRITSNQPSMVLVEQPVVDEQLQPAAPSITPILPTPSLNDFKGRMHTGATIYRVMMSGESAPKNDEEVKFRAMAHRDIECGIDSVLPAVNPNGDDLTVYYPAAGFDIAMVLASTDATTLIYTDLRRDFMEQGRTDNFTAIVEEIGSMGGEIVSQDIPPQGQEGRCEIKFKLLSKDGILKDRVLIYYSGVDAEEFVPQEIDSGYDILWVANPDMFMSLPQIHEELFRLLKEGGFTIFGNGGVSELPEHHTAEQMFSHIPVLQFDEQWRFVDINEPQEGFILGKKNSKAINTPNAIPGAQEQLLDIMPSLSQRTSI